MTREEARDLLAMIEIEEPNELIVNSWWGSFVNDYKEALQMAIEALEQQPREDAISREEALQALCKAVHKNDDTIPCSNQRVSCLWSKTKVQDYAEEILKLPFVTPKEKIGKWIDDANKIDAQFGRHTYICSECGKYAEYFISGTEVWWDRIKPNFCPNCGAKMVEPQESEDKE